MKIAIYTIAKNEAHEVAEWANATDGADHRLVVDTGSDDGTVEQLEAKGVTVARAVVRPWRFDDAFNIALGLLPEDADAVFRVDMDERPRPGWRTVIEREWEEGLCTLRYPYWWSRETSFYVDKVHCRHGFRYRGATHEGLVWRGSMPYRDKTTDDLVVDHFFKNEKPRPHDLSILEEALRDDPNDARMILHYGREMIRWNRLTEGAAHLRRFMDLSGKDGIDAAFCWRQLAVCEPEQRLEHLLRAEQAYDLASVQLALAEYYYEKTLWRQCYSAIQQCIAFIRINVNAGAGHWADDIRLRGPMPHDYAAVSAWNMWDFEAAYGHAVEAVRRDPERAAHRMQNLETMAQKIKEGGTTTDIPKRPVLITTRKITEQVEREPNLSAAD